MDSIGVLVAIAAIIAIAVVAFIFSGVSKPSNSLKIESDVATSGDGTKKPATHQKGKAGMRGKHTAHSDKAVHPKHPLEINLLKGHTEEITGIALSADGRGLATACSDGLVRVFPMTDITTRDFKFLRIPMEAGVYPTGVAFGRGATQVAVTANTPKGAALLLYGAAADKEAQAAIQAGKLPPFAHQWEQRPAHSGFKGILTVSSACATHEHGDGTPVVTTCSEATEVKVWAVNSSGDGGREVGTVDSNQLKNTMAAMSPDGRFLAAAAFTADVKIWEVVCAKGGGVQGVERVMQLKGHKSAVTWLCFSWDSKRVVTTSKDGTIKVWNIDVRYRLDEDPKCLLTLPNPEIGPPAVVPHIEEANGKKGKKSKQSEQEPVFPTLDRIALAPDNSTLAIVHGSTLAWLDIGSREVIETVDQAHDGRIVALAWSPVKHRISGGVQSYVLATGGLDKKVRLWKSPQ